MIDQNTFSSSAVFHGAKGLVFVNEEQIVVFRRDNKTKNFPLMIDLPGGGREENETPFETFRREAREEFAIHLEEKDIVFSKTYPSVLNPNEQSYFMVTKPLNLSETEIVLGDEGLEFFLMTPEEFVALHDGIERQQARTKEYLGLIRNS